MLLILIQRNSNTILSKESLNITSFQNLINYESEEIFINITCCCENESNINVKLEESNKKNIKYIRTGRQNHPFEYISASRINPSWFYKGYENSETELGFNGEYTLSFLELNGANKTIHTDFYNYFGFKDSSDNSLMSQVRSFMGFVSSGINIYPATISETNLVRVLYKYDDCTEQVNPLNIGYGITNSLPVVVSLLKAKPGEFIILENPENNIHPQGQTKIGELIAYVASKGVQVFVETHSDHVLNGIRIFSIKREFSNNINIMYFNREKNVSSFTSVKIDKNGGFSKMPEGFMDEWDNSLDTMLGIK